MRSGLWWATEQALHIARRSQRYPGAADLEVAWTLEAAADPRRLVQDPDPRSRSGATRIVGWSSGAGYVLTVIVDPVDGAGITAWKSSGGDLRAYEGRES